MDPIWIGLNPDSIRIVSEAQALVQTHLKIILMSWFSCTLHFPVGTLRRICADRVPF